MAIWNNAHPIYFGDESVMLIYTMYSDSSILYCEEKMVRDLMCGLMFESENFSHGIKTTRYRYLSACLFSSDCSLKACVAMSFLFMVHVNCLHIPTQPSQQSE